ncbi:hypothetical protein [Segatella hominis]|uniref:hypothetical protein n=5 Tax=Segatella hominis TaxID=2518605 RepID=UPI003AB0080A
MKGIARFFTLYWIIYFPTCIAYNDLPGFSSVDEAMTVLLFVYTLWMYCNNRSINKRPWKEFTVCIGLIAFYTVYSLLFGANVAGSVWIDLMQEIRPYTIIFCTWILNPRFTKKQKKWMLGTMVLTLFSWILYHPATFESQNAEFPVLGQLAICTGMSWYLFTKATKRNRYIALLLVLTGMMAPKFKFIGEVVCFIAFVFFVKQRLNFKSPKTMIYVVLLITILLMVTWTRFDAYYISGMSNDDLARPMTYKTSLKILFDYWPFGSGMGSFACNGAWQYYSPLYFKYNLDGIWGLSPNAGGFICDAYYPTLAQFGFVGVFFFCWFWKRRLAAFDIIADMRYYRVAMITFCCLAIEQTADSSWLSGKGMGYCMLIALCLNANRNAMEQMKRRKLQLNRMKNESKNLLD